MKEMNIRMKMLIKKILTKKILIKKLVIYVACIVAVALFAFVPREVLADVLVKQMEADTRVIPDKYNTGCNGTLTEVVIDATSGVTINNVAFIQRADSASVRCVLDCYYRNKEVTGTICFENYDFSDYQFWVYNSDKVDRKIKFIFKNCRFGSVSVGRGATNITCEFDNCTIRSFNGSNTTFNRCQFGNSYSDGIVPFCNIKVNDCFFTNMTSMPTDAGAHIDGTQIYGYADVEVSNVAYSNCRFEVPPLRVAPLTGTESKAYVNACIMYQLEYNSAKNVSFKDCIVNGGGYSIYARSKDVNKYTSTHVTFDGIKFGCANKWGIFYTNMDNAIKITNVSQTDSLYVGTVWKEGGKTHFSVTNDTNIERKLLIYTDKGTFNYTVPACPKGSAVTDSMTYKDMPFDVDIEISADCKYAVCFDGTTGGMGKQLRFMNWSGEQVNLPSSVTDTLYSGVNDILSSGKCGNNITYTLTKSGILTLSGTGATYNYHSAKFPEWNEYKDYIREVRVGEGIEGLGSMIFRQCAGIQKVTLPSTLKTIGQYAFGGCVSLKEFTIPAGVTTLGKNVFSGSPLYEIHYAGDNWSAVKVESGNDNLIAKLVVDKELEKNPVKNPDNNPERNPVEETKSQDQKGTQGSTETTGNTENTEKVPTDSNETESSDDNLSEKESDSITKGKEEVDESEGEKKDGILWWGIIIAGVLLVVVGFVIYILVNRRKMM